MEEKITILINEALKKLNIQEVNFSIEHPEDLKNGDYSTNVAMITMKNFTKLKEEMTEKTATEKPTEKKSTEKTNENAQNKNKNIENENQEKTSPKNPKELAEIILKIIKENLPTEIERVEIAGAGFINFYLSKDFFQNSIVQIISDEAFGQNQDFSNRKVMIEYTQPNPFKPFHIGHLMSNTIGESISRFFQFSGANTIRANYQGDIGLHVAKAIWGIFQKGKPDENLSVSEKAGYIGECYSFASSEYEKSEEIKNEIDNINKKIYQKSDEKINALYDWGRKITLEAFELIYKRVDTTFDYYFFESEMVSKGEKIVTENTGKVFEESDGAIVFKAEKYDPKLHTRVFITKHGLPTYETKEIGLAITKFEKENPDISITITATEQGEYMKVVRKAIEEINPEIAEKMKHITHGMMRFATGKMSSRAGNIITGESLIFDVQRLVYEKIKEKELKEDEKNNISEVVGISALKYSILKQSTGAHIVYDFDKSISFEGDSGPYLQYSYARAKSILRKAEDEKIILQNLKEILETLKKENFPIQTYELEKMFYIFPEVVKRARKEYEPHYVATYLIELSRAFNSFYANTQIVEKDNPLSLYRIALTKAFSIILKNGLWLLGIKAPEKM